MSEINVISKTTRGPVTRKQIIADLQALGVQRNDTLLVHSSLSRLGWVVGGAVTVVRSLLEVVGPEGTIIMPTYSSQLSDPAKWKSPPVDESWWSTIKENMFPFDPAVTPTRGMGAIVDCFRSVPGINRSNHPQTSFAALGKHAGSVTANHILESSFGENSPLARLYELNGKVLLLGVGHNSNSSLHLAEYRADYKTKKHAINGAPGPEPGTWTEFSDIDFDSSDFEELGAEFEKNKQVVSGKVGYGSSRLFYQQHLVDFAVDWLERNR